MSGRLWMAITRQAGYLRAIMLTQEQPARAVPADARHLLPSHAEGMSPVHLVPRMSAVQAGPSPVESPRQACVAEGPEGAQQAGHHSKHRQVE